MANVAFILILVILFLLVAVVFPRWGISRAIPSVIQLFRHRNAIGKDNAKTIDELGLRPARKGFIETMFGPRDYRPAALGHLVKAKVIQVTEDRKLYLSEENLAASKWKDH